MGFDLQKMMKEAQKMQDRVNTVQTELGGVTVIGSAGGGAVTVTCNGRAEVLAVKITPEAADDVETLQDLVLAALQDAHKRATDTAQQKMAAITQGLNIPGLPF
jgi:DNA-binding YbaB/EbfC family protein